MPASPELTNAEQALVRSARAWGVPDPARFWARFHPAWRARLSRETSVEEEPEGALAALRRAQAAEARPDLSQIHPSWWIRALQDESPAVRRAVVAGQVDPLVRAALLEGLNLEETDLEPDAPPHPEALAWALALWSERLVGGPPAHDGDSGIVRLLAELPSREVSRLIRWLGLAKLAFLPAGDEDVPLPASDRAHVESLRLLWDTPEASLVQVARHDLAANWAARELTQRLGLVTIGRLLARVEPHRARWTLQHLPYTVAKFVRAQMNRSDLSIDDDLLFSWESRLLDAVWDRWQGEQAEPVDDSDTAEPGDEPS